MTLFKAISGREGDFVSGWIYIPNNIQITGNEVLDALKQARNVVLHCSNVNVFKHSVASFFSRDYSPKKYRFTYKPTGGERFGVRYIDDKSLLDILGPDRYQPYYSTYKAVFLLRKDDGVKISPRHKDKFDDLTKELIKQTCVLQPPTQEQLQHLGRGVKVFHEGKVFSSPIALCKGNVVELIAKRDGFEPARLPEIKVEKEIEATPPFHNIDWEKQISASMFDIRDQDGNKIANATIRVKGQYIRYGGIKFHEKDLHEAEVEVQAYGYDDFRGKYSLLIEGRVEIRLNRTVRTEEYKIRLSNGQQADLKLSSAYLPSQESPLKGYSLDENNRLEPSRWYLWKERIKGMASGILLCALCCMYCWLSGWFDTHEFKCGLPPWKEKVAQHEEVGDTTSQDSVPSTSTVDGKGNPTSPTSPIKSDQPEKKPATAPADKDLKAASAATSKLREDSIINGDL